MWLMLVQSLLSVQASLQSMLVSTVIGPVGTGVLVDAGGGVLVAPGSSVGVGSGVGVAAGAVQHVATLGSAVQAVSYSSIEQ